MTLSGVDSGLELWHFHKQTEALCFCTASYLSPLNRKVHHESEFSSAALFSSSHFVNMKNSPSKLSVEMKMRLIRTLLLELLHFKRIIITDIQSHENIYTVKGKNKLIFPT